MNYWLRDSGSAESWSNGLCFPGQQGKKHNPEFVDQRWIIQLSLLTGITIHLNALNLQLQWRDKLTSNMLNAIRASQNKITALYIPDRDLIHSGVWCLMQILTLWKYFFYVITYKCDSILNTIKRKQSSVHKCTSSMPYKACSKTLQI